MLEVSPAQAAKKNHCLHERRSARLTALASVLGTGFILISGAAHAACENTPEGRVCTVQQPITAGTVVDNATQKALGLVTVDGGCSGTLLSQFVVLTARHCVQINPQIPRGPLKSHNDVTVTAAWAPGVTAAVDSIADFKKNPKKDDIILLRLGWPNFGAVDTQRIYSFGLRGDGGSIKLSGRLRDTDLVTQYGRGLSTYASGIFGTPSAKPATGLGTYRSAQFKPSDIRDVDYDLAMNGSSQVGHGGDSGGPTVVTAPDGFNLGIAGVQSTCDPQGYLMGAPSEWQWATGINYCTYISTERFINEINEAKRANGPVDNKPACNAYAARQFARVAEARRLDCAFLKGSGGWDKDEAAYARSCLSTVSAIAINESGLQSNLDRCKNPPVPVAKVCADYAQMMVEKGKKVIGTKCEPLANSKTKDAWIIECNEGFLRLPGRLPYDMNAQAQMYEGTLQNCLLSLKDTDQGPATPQPPQQKFVEVVQSVDVYAKPGGEEKDRKKDAGGTNLTLEAGTKGVTLLETQENWFHVKWPGDDGWVYSGEDYVSLKLP